MKRRRSTFLSAAVVAGLMLACLIGASAPVRADSALLSLTPFGPRTLPRLDPFQKSPIPTHSRAQAEPAPNSDARPDTGTTTSTGTSTGTSASPVASAIACTRDDQCPADTICEQGSCRPFERATSILLYRHEGAFTAFLPFYFSRRGNPGYRVIPPLYWHFWSPEGHTKIVAPFFWRFEDFLKQRVITVVFPYSHTKQPDAESWAVWPVFYASTKFGWVLPPLLSFRIADPQKGNSWALYGLLYFSKRNEPAKTAFDLLFPLFVSSRSTDSAFTFALPLNFYWRTNRDANLLVLPLFYRNQQPNDLTVATLLGYASSSGRNSTGSVFWLYWWGRDATASHDVLFPLLWSFRNQASSTTVAVPLFLHVRRNSWSFTAFPFPIVPLAFAGSDEAKGSAWKLFIPFVFWKSGEHGKKVTWVTLLGGYTRDRDAGTSALTLGVYFRRRDPQRELDVFFPLYWRYKNLAEDTTTHLVGPVYRQQDPQGSTTSVLALFWHFRDAETGATAHTLLPLYFRRTSPTETTTAAGVLPLWFYYRRFAGQDWTAGLFPLVHFGHRGETRDTLVFPLLYHRKDAQQSTTVALPLFYHWAQDKQAATGVLPLLYFQGHDSHSAYRIQFPFLWRFTDATKGTASTVLPPFFYQSDKTGWSAGLAPLLFASGGGPRGHFVLFPLLWHFRDDAALRSTTLVLSYLHRREGTQITDALFPFLYYRRGTNAGGSAESSLAFFPLFHYRHDAHSTVFLSPLASWSRSPERKGGYVLPYFWYESKRVAVSGVPPLFFDFTNLHLQERTRMWGPFIRVDAPGRTATILFPLAARYVDAHESGTYIFPTFFHRRTDSGYAVDTLLPVFWHSTYPGHETTVVGTWFRTRGPDSAATGLLPLFVYADSPKRTVLATPLFYRNADHEAQTSTLAAALLFYKSTNPAGGRTVLFPFWWAHDRGPAHSQVLFPIYWHWRNTEEQSDTVLAGPFYWASHGRQRARGILPLAWYSRTDADANGNNASGSNAVLPLFYESHGPLRKTFVTLLWGYRTSIDRNWWYAGLLFRRDNTAASFTMLFPLWFQNFNKLTETTTRVIPPLLHFASEGPDRSLVGWLGLFWRHRTVTSSTTLLLPVFYDIHSLHESRTTMLLPLFIRHSNEAENSSWALAPLFYRRTSPVDSTTVAFPLLWDFNSPEKRTTFLFPLFAHFRRPTYVADFVFPNIYYRRGLGDAAGTHRLFVFPVWESAIKRPGDYMWEVLLGLVGWERIGRNRFMKLLFIPFELEAAPAAQTAWYGRQPPQRRPRRAQGLSTQIW